MTIIDRYLLRQFVQTFLICLVSLTGIFIVFDAFTNLDAFLNYGEKQGNVMAAMGKYYACHSVWFFNRTLGLITLTAAMFTVTWIQRHNELTALMAAGISRVRVVMPVILGAAAVMLLGVVNREFAIPQLREELAKRPRDLLGNSPRELEHQYDQNNLLIRGKAGFSDRRRIEKPVFRLPQEFDSYTRQVTASDAFYRPAEGDRPAGYLLEGVDQPKDLHLLPSLDIQGKRVIFTPKDNDWLKPGQCFIATDVTFEQLTDGRQWRDFSSTLELIRGLQTRGTDYSGASRVMIHSRFVQPLLDLTMLFLGLPLVAARGSRNVFFAMGLCGAVVSGFMLVVIGCQRLGAIYLISPALAAWAPLLLFAPVAVEMAFLMRK
jgi:lipopolysaccharide export system permease protein